MDKSIYARFQLSGKEIELIEDELPQLKDGEILVKNTYTTLCTSDLHTYKGSRKEKSPTILGHEITGYIVSLGFGDDKFDQRGKKLSIGDRITWAIFASDPEDPNSKRGIPQKAKNIFKYGHEQISEDNKFHGGLAQFTVIRKNTPIVCLNDAITDPVAALINCSMATMAAAIRLAGDLKNKHVLISGAGMLGLVGIAMVSKSEASSLATLDINLNRLDIARSFGAQEAEVAVSHLKRKYDVIIETSGYPKVIEETLSKLEIGGTAVWLGAVFPQEDLHINAEFIVRNLITIKGLHNYNELDLVSAVEFIEQYIHQFNFGKLVHQSFTLSNVNDAFRFALNESPYRVGIEIH